MTPRTQGLDDIVTGLFVATFASALLGFVVFGFDPTAPAESAFDTANLIAAATSQALN
jgi:hypothetical protein